MATIDSPLRSPTAPVVDRAAFGTPHVGDPASAVSWSAIFAGAAAAAALSLILAILGVGLGLSSVSPWANAGADAGTFGLSTILWLAFTSVAASGLGGYLAGRLRARWLAVHADEIYFRDTAHGFLAWAVATLVTAAVLGSAIGAIVSGTAKAGASVAGGAAGAVANVGGMAAAGAAGRAGDDASSGAGPMAYAVDSLMRRSVAPAPAPAPADSGSAISGADPSTGAISGGTMSSDAGAAPAPVASNDPGPAPTAEVGRIFANALRTGSLGADDTRYLGQLVARRSGLPAADAEKRVTDAFAKLQTGLRDAETRAREAADKARKAAAYASLWLFVSLLAGAFVASWAATFGGRRRDF